MSALVAGWLPVVDALGWTLLHFLWQGALIGLLYAALRPWLPSGQVRYGGALAALALLMLAPVVTLTLRLLPQTAAEPASLAAAAESLAANAIADGGIAGAEPWLPWLVGAWALGVFGLTIRALVHWRSLLQLMRTATALPQWEARLAALRQRFGIRRTVRLLCSERVDTPTLVGWLRPVILLPAAVALGFPAAQLELILAHELGHVRRWDYVVNLVQVVLETVLFYHPVVHWISRELRHEREICCDEMVLRLTEGHPHVYARTLASLEELRGTENTPLALAASGGVLLDRVQRVVGIAPEATALAARPIARVLPLLLAGVIVLAGMIGQQVQRDRLVLLPWQLARMLTLDVTVSRLEVGDLALAPKWSRPRLEPASVASDVAPVESLPLSIAPPAAHLDVPTEAPDVSPAPVTLAAATASSAASAAATVPALPAPEHALRAPQPIKVVQPLYPDSALRQGLEGEVLVEFELGVGGDVIATHVVSAQPEHVFDAAALQALRWWRYDPATVRPGTRYQQNFMFALGGSRLPKLVNYETVNAETECRKVTGSRLCRRPDGSEQSTRTHGVETLDRH